MRRAASQGLPFIYTEPNTRTVREIGFAHNDMHVRLASNPVAAAIVFIRMVNCVMTHLLGRAPETEYKRSAQSKSSDQPASSLAGKKGVFGPLFAIGGCVETQGRGTLHIHVNLWGGLSPRVLQHAAPFDIWRKHVANTLDRMLQAGLPKILLLDQLVAEISGDIPHNHRRRQNAFMSIPAPPSDLEDKDAVAAWKSRMEKAGHRVCLNCNVSKKISVWSL
jgi:hypothetical protein